MALSWASWLPVLRPFLSESLVDSEALHRLQTLTQHLPMEGLGVIEVRLAADSDAVDFSIRLTQPDQADGLPEQIISPHLRDFLSRGWRELGCPKPISSVWLEFDLGRASDALPAPIVCTRFEDPVDSDWLIDSLFPAIHEAPLTRDQKRLLRCCVAEAKEPGKVLYAFSLLPRSTDAVRLELYGLNPIAMGAYLGRTTPLMAKRQMAELAPLIEDCDRYHLSFDIGNEILPRLGVECGFLRLPDQEPRWAGLLDRLVTRGLCLPEKREAVLRWSGYDSLWTAPQRWPEGDEGLGGYCVRCLSHVKLVSWPGRQPEAKAYLLFQHFQRSTLPILSA